MGEGTEGRKDPAAGWDYAVVGIGNAIVDVIAEADDALLAREGLVKGTMALIDAARADELYARMGPAQEISGGSAANTMVGLASLGSSAAFIGKLRDDQLGAIFRHDIRAAGVHFETEPARDGPPSARSLILVTPDAQRTMSTFLGASTAIEPGDLDETLIESAAVTYLEGYLWDAPPAKAAFLKAAEAAHAAGREVALSLSDPFCVERHRDSFQELVDGHIDLLFANEKEIQSLYQTDSFEAASEAVRGRCRLAILTRSEKGAIVLSDGESVAVPAEPVARVEDTTGAGDLFAAGFLHGYTQGRKAATCAKLGAIAAAEVIGHLGARPKVRLAELIGERQAGF